MHKYFRLFIVCLTFCFSFSRLFAQMPSNSPDVKADYSGEAFVIEQSFTRIAFENDGTYQRESNVQIRIQSDAGVQHYNVLTLPYQKSTETLGIDYVRVRKPDGTAVVTPQDNVQDMPAEVTRQAPLYSDLQESHIAVKGLGVGDVLEIKFHVSSAKPLAPGQFWYSYNFDHDGIILQEQLQISAPRDREVRWKSPKSKPIVTDEGARRIFTWKSSHLKSKAADKDLAEKEQELLVYQAVRGKLPPPEVLISSFQSWEEVGRWYSGLQQERVKPTAEIRAKAAELTRDAADESAKLHGIYNYVSTQFRYIGIDFGIGRYQPHSASDVLDNQYGDCKDKHTLLASLLEAAGIKAYPALINSAREIDLDVPSPGQFDHVISVVFQGSQTTWLDTTPELAPYAYLMNVLRDKQALVIPPDKSATLMATPADPPSKALESFTIQAKLSATGVLEGKIEHTVQGNDGEVLVRSAFRRVPLPQWKDLIQQISYASGFAGDVSDATASSPQKLDEPFRFAYSYSRKDFSDWANRRISSPLPQILLPSLQHKDSQPSHPIWLGPSTEQHLKSYLELPKGYTPTLPGDVDLKESFAEYHASYSIRNGALVAERRFLLKLREVPISEYEAYKKFSKAVEDDYETYIDLTSSRSPARTYQDEIWKLPYSDKLAAVRAYDEARDKYQEQDLKGEIAALTRAVEIDPRFTRAWLWLGEVYKFARQNDRALGAYRKAVAVDPPPPIAYTALGLMLMQMKKFEESVPVWQQLIKIAPTDSGAEAGLGGALLGLKRYDEAVAAFETAIKLNPQLATLHGQLGSAYLRAGNNDKALAAYQKAIELDPQPTMLNSIGYELVDVNAKMAGVAMEYAQKAVSAEEEASQNVNLAELQVEDLEHTANLAAFWDTLGWVHFRMDHLEQAEKYLNAAWMLSQGGDEAEHLGQVYEAQHKKQAAIHMHRLALFCFSLETARPVETDKIRERLGRLALGSSTLAPNSFPELSGELNAMRTAKLARLAPGTANADFFLVFAQDPKASSVKVEEAKFISGSEALKSAGTALKGATFKVAFPDDVPSRILRRGIITCYEATGCAITLLLPNDVHSVN